MKNLGFIAFLSLALFSCEENNKVQMGKKTSMQVNAIYNAGKVAKGEVIHAKFTVKNTGDYALVLSDVKGSCSCTVADWSKDPIAPGEVGYIKAQVNTESFTPGQVSRSVRILANTTPPETTVSVEATVIK